MMESGFIESMLAYAIGPFTLGQLLLSFGIVLLTLFLRGLLTKTLFTNLKRLAARTRWEHDDRFLEALEKPTSSFILVLGIFMAVVALPLDDEWMEVIDTLFRGISIFIVFWGLFRLADVLVDVMASVSSASGNDSFRGFGNLVKKSLRVFIIIVGVVMVVGSIALALDRPFRVGDWIQVGSVVDGDVEEIGLRSTKVRTWPKTVISIPNAVLANEMINNWSRMPKRRVKQVVGVTYETRPETMEQIVEAIRDVLRTDEGVNQEFILVNWTDFGSSSLDILVYYFTTTTKWLEHMDIRQRINVKIAKVVAAHGSSVAFPTRTLYLEGEVARKLAGGVELPGDNGPQAPM